MKYTVSEGKLVLSLSTCKAAIHISSTIMQRSNIFTACIVKYGCLSFVFSHRLALKIMEKKCVEILQEI